MDNPCSAARLVRADFDLVLVGVKTVAVKIKYIIRELSDDGLVKPIERFTRYEGWKRDFMRQYDSQEEAIAAIEESGYDGDFVLLTVATK